VTSAMKGLSSATEWAIDKHYAGAWAEIGDVATVLDAKTNAVGLPTETWSMENYTIEQYEAMLAAMADGTLVVDNTVYENDGVCGLDLPNLTIIYE